jgi:hypothetical protein
LTPEEIRIVEGADAEIVKANDVDPAPPFGGGGGGGDEIGWYGLDEDE